MDGLAHEKALARRFITMISFRYGGVGVDEMLVDNGESIGIDNDRK